MSGTDGPAGTGPGLDAAGDFGGFEGWAWLNCAHQGPLPLVAPVDRPGRGAHRSVVMTWPSWVAVAKSLLIRFLVTAQAIPVAVSPQAKLPPTPP